MASDIVVSYVLKHKYYVEILEYKRKPQRNVTLKLILKYRDESMILRTEHARTEQNADHDIFFVLQPRWHKLALYVWNEDLCTY